MKVPSEKSPSRAALVEQQIKTFRLREVITDKPIFYISCRHVFFMAEGFGT